MINSIQAPASHVVAIQLEGSITKDDVHNVIAKVENTLEHQSRINLFLEMTGVSGMSPVAFLNDLGYGIKNMGRLYRFQQIAVVTDNPTLERIVGWEDKLLKAVEIQAFSNDNMTSALAWVEKPIEMPEPGYSAERYADYLHLSFGSRLSGFDVVRLCELIRDTYEEQGPVKLLAETASMPEFGPGVIYEKLRQLRLVELVSRYAVVGPKGLRTRIKIANPLIKAQLKYFPEDEKEAALAWLREAKTGLEILPSARDDRFLTRISGKITDKEVEQFYQALLGQLRGENALDVLLELPYEDGITLKAVFQAIKLGMQHYGKVTKGIRRLAIITDSRFLSKATEFENLLTPSVDEKPFSFSQRDAAEEWLDEGRPALASVTKLLPAVPETTHLDSCE